MTEKRKRVEVSAYKPLLDGIVALLEDSRRATGRAVNSILTATYWEIGRRIVEEEQRGRRKADYGEQLVEQLASELTARFGKGFSRTNVFQMRQFYTAFREIIQTPSGPSSAVTIVQTLSGQLPAFPLSWSHYVRLLSVPEQPARRFTRSKLYVADGRFASWIGRSPLSFTSALRLHAGTSLQGSNQAMSSRLTNTSGTRSCLNSSA